MAKIKIRLVLLATSTMLSCTLTQSAGAQDLSAGEVIVTAKRAEQDDYQRDMPAVGLRKTADFLVQEVTISGDSRDPKQRVIEIRKMLQEACALAAKSGVQLAYGDFLLTPLTTENLDDVTLVNDSRPDSQKLTFLVKAPLGSGSGAAAQKRIDAYVEAVPEVGRAQMDETGDPSLSVVAPDQYRGQIAQKVMDDARALAARMGDGYAVSLEGLNMPVQWSRAGSSDVILYIPYKLTVVPKP